MEEVTSYRRRENVQPGWIYDVVNYTFISKWEAKNDRSPIASCSFLLKYSSLKRLSEKNNLYSINTEYAWQKDLDDNKPKNAFLLREKTSFVNRLSDDLMQCCINGTVTEVTRSGTVSLLVLTNDETDVTSDAVKLYVDRILSGKEENISQDILKDCFKSFVYVEKGSCPFNSLIHALKEYIRLINDMKKYHNAKVLEFKHAKITEYDTSENAKIHSSVENSQYGGSVEEKNPEYSGSIEIPKTEGYSFPAEKAKTEEYDGPIKSGKIVQGKVENPIAVWNTTKEQEEFKNNVYSEKVFTENAEYDTVTETKYGFGNATMAKNKEICDVRNLNPAASSSIMLGGTILNESKLLPANSILNDEKSVLDSMVRDSKTLKNNNVQTEGLNPTKAPINESLVHDSDERNQTYTFNRSTNEGNGKLSSTIIKEEPPKHYVSISIPTVAPISINDVSNDHKMTTYRGSYNEVTEEEGLVETKKQLDNGNSLNKTERSICVKCESKHKYCGDSIINPAFSKDSGDIINVKIMEKELELSTSEENGVRRVVIGNLRNAGGHKTILLIGATGSGKTALVNFIANYYFGAQKADEEKIYVDSAKGKTSNIALYSFYPTDETKFPVTIIDTPGLNDSTGAEIHDHVDALKSFLASAFSQGLEIHAIGFVAQAHLVRLTSSEKLVMDHVKSLFGSSIESHLITFVTFSDNQTTPPVIEAMEAYGIAAKFFVKFNNSLLCGGSKLDDLDQIYWKIGSKSWKKCLKYLNEMNPLPRTAVETVSKDVYNRTVWTKNLSNLNSVIYNCFSMVKDSKSFRELYSDESKVQRRIVWNFTNKTFYLCLDKRFETKEQFLIDTCFNLISDSFLSDFLLFLILDEESSFRKNFLSLIDSASEVARSVENLNWALLQKNTLSSFCSNCMIECRFKREIGNTSSISQKKMYLLCDCPCDGLDHKDSGQSNIHQPYFLKASIFRLVSKNLNEVIKKYAPTAFDIHVHNVLNAITFNEPEYKRRDIVLFANKYCQEEKTFGTKI